MEAFPVYGKGRPVFLDLDPEPAETIDCSHTIGSFEKIADHCSAACDGTEHHAAVGDRFVPRNTDAAFQPCNTA